MFSDVLNYECYKYFIGQGGISSLALITFHAKRQALVEAEELAQKALVEAEELKKQILADVEKEREKMSLVVLC